MSEFDQPYRDITPTDSRIYRDFDRMNFLLTVIAIFVGLVFVAGIVLGWIAYAKVIDRLDEIKNYTEITSENTVTP